MKPRIQLAAVILLTCLLVPLASLNTGCVTPGHDPVVVQAERFTELSVDMFDGFLRWEKNNREALRGTPEVKAAADHIRANAQDWLLSARVMTKAYKQNRTPENKANLETALTVLSAGVEEAKRYWIFKPQDQPLAGAMSPALLLALLAAAAELAKLAPKWIKDMKGRGEMTPEEEALLDKRIAELKDQEHWNLEP